MRGSFPFVLLLCNHSAGQRIYCTDPKKVIQDLSGFFISGMGLYFDTEETSVYHHHS